MKNLNFHYDISFFSYPQEPITPSEPEEHKIYHWASQTGRDEDDCWEKFPQCPFSLIDLVLGYYSENIGWIK